jgi:hypothetical protein
MVNWLLTGPTGPEDLALRGGLCLLAGKHTGILTHFQTKVKKKNKKLATEHTDLRRFLYF